ncbi:MAG: ribosome assembly RNA-binding protein YhbY [Myxococcales bacterium]|nr:ribosome assembly RNA-binding protein YhbY [Myxococcales bacterium]
MTDKSAAARSLSVKARQYLKGLAHHLKPVVHIGKGGIDDGVIAALDEALEQHELIKVRLLDTAPFGRKESAQLLADVSSAFPVDVIGRIAILYRQRKKKPEIVLPR